jgi:hypothetical protein
MFIEMCPPLLSDSLNIKCTLNGKNSDCSNPSVPDTIAKPTCKFTHYLPNGQEKTPIELHCQSNGIWNNQLQPCIPCNCIFKLYSYIFSLPIYWIIADFFSTYVQRTLTNAALVTVTAINSVYINHSCGQYLAHEE